MRGVGLRSPLLVTEDGSDFLGDDSEDPGVDIDTEADYGAFREGRTPPSSRGLKAPG